MSIFIDSKQSLLDYINSANGVTRFNGFNLLFSNPQPTKGTWREETTTKNTYVKATASVSADFKGKAFLTYDRLNLADFSHFRPVRKLPCYKVTTVHQLLSNILYYYALKLGTADVEDDPLTLDGTGAGTITVRAKTTSLIWTGSITFDVIPGGALVDDFLKVTLLAGLNYPVDDFATQTSAILYTYGFNFSEWRDIFIPIPEGVLLPANAAKVADALKVLDKGIGALLWTATDAVATAWNLWGAKVIHNGLNSTEYPSNQTYKYVMVLELASTVTKPSGRFILHYNDPEDPNAIE